MRTVAHGAPVHETRVKTSRHLRGVPTRVIESSR